MTIEAPACGINGCPAPSWGPCERHSILAAEDPQLLWSVVKIICPSLEGPVHPSTIRTAINATVARSVQDRCLAIFPALDSHDAQSRDAQLMYLRDALAQPLRPLRYVDVAYDYTNMMAHLDWLASLEEDQIDFAVQEHIMLSYLHYAEWSMARAMGYQVDFHGVRLDQPLQDYMMAQHHVMNEVVRDHFADNLRHYPEAVQLGTGHLPLNPQMPARELFLKGQDRLRFYAIQATQTQIIAKREARKAAVGQFVLQQIQEYNTPQARAARAIERDRAESRDFRDRQENRMAKESRERSKSRSITNEYYRHLNRKHRRASGWLF